MNKIISLQKMNYGYAWYFAVAVVLLAALMMASQAHAATFSPLTGQMSVGSSGNNVINLQTFLASDHNIYADGRVTGYYGMLTYAAVVQFQLNYGISTVGNVGPVTLAKMNSVIAAGHGIDVYAPSIYNVAVQKTTTTATFNWATTEPAGGKVYYSANPMSGSEAIGNFTEPSIVGGTTVLAMNSQGSQSVVVNGLQPNTTYYYIIEAADASGNVTVTTQSTFVTNQ